MAENPFIKKRKQIHFTIFYVLLMLAVITMPFTQFFMLPIELAMLLNWIAEWNWNEKWNNLKINNLKSMFWVFLAFYLTMLLGVFYSVNFSYAFADLDCKSWLWVAPLLIFTSNRNLFAYKKIVILLLAFMNSCLFMMLFYTGRAIWRYMKDGVSYHLFYCELSPFLHPSYNAMYVTFAFVVAICFLFFKNNIFQAISNRYITFICIFITLTAIPFVCLLQSKAGILIMALAVVLLLILWINKDKHRYIATTCGLLIVLIAFGLAAKYTPVNQRLSHAWNELKQWRQNSENSENSNSGTLERINIWKISCLLGKENLPFGVGTGDAKQALMDRYDKENMTLCRQSELNAHNQYLQTLIATGIPGCLALLLWFIIPGSFALKKRNICLCLLIMICLLNMLVESMLEVRAGVNFMAIFMAIIVLTIMQKEPTNV